jgi:hypothetical protein
MFLTLLLAWVLKVSSSTLHRPGGYLRPLWRFPPARTPASDAEKLCLEARRSHFTVLAPTVGRAANRNRIMKVTIEVDCTPEEARRFIGLPDVVPMQQVIIEKLQQRLVGAIDATTPEALLKAWMPMAPNQMQQAFATLFGAFGGLKPGERS